MTSRTLEQTTSRSSHSTNSNMDGFGRKTTKTASSSPLTQVSSGNPAQEENLMHDSSKLLIGLAKILMEL